MTLPAITKFTAAGMLLNQRITFTSLNQTLSAAISIITTQAIAKGYTRVGSCNGTTGALDGVSRWSATAAVRGATTTTAQSWDIIQAANGAQTLFTYTGGSDDICTIACSPGGLYILAGTPTFKPTATDECTGPTAQSIIGSTASADRIIDVWIDSAHNGWRCAIFRSNILVSPLFGVELFDPAYIVSPAVCTIPVWVFSFAASQVPFPNNIITTYAANTGGQTKMTVSGVQFIVSMGTTANTFANSCQLESNLIQELNGGLFMYRTLGLASQTTSAKGWIGNRFDWIVSNDFRPCGDLDATKSWIMMNQSTVAGATAGVLWTWDNTSAWVGA